MFPILILPVTVLVMKENKKKTTCGETRSVIHPAFCLTRSP